MSSTQSPLPQAAASTKRAENRCNDVSDGSSQMQKHSRTAKAGRNGGAANLSWWTAAYQRAVDMLNDPAFKGIRIRATGLAGSGYREPTDDPETLKQHAREIGADATYFAVTTNGAVEFPIGDVRTPSVYGPGEAGRGDGKHGEPAVRVETELPIDKTPLRKQKRERPQVPAFQPFPVDVLPEPIRGFVSQASTAIGCDPSYVALPLLAGLASSIGNTHRIQLKRGWSEPCVLWCAVIGDSGTLKSPAIDIALRRIRERQAKALDEFKIELEEYDRAVEIHKADMTAWRKSGHKNGEPLPLPPDKPTSGRRWCSDSTVEALAAILGDAPRGILVIRDELSGLLRGFDQYKSAKGADVAHYLEMHRAGHLLVDRKTGDRSMISVPRAAVSIAGGVPPETLRRALGAENFENGLAARFLMVMPPRRAKRWRDATVNRAIEGRMNGVFDWLFSLESGMDEDGNPRPVLIPLSPEGQEAWIEFYNDFAAEQSDLTGPLAAAASKLEGCAGRLALVVHLVRSAAGELNLGDPIDKESVGAGVSLVRWFLQETRRVYAILGETDGERGVRQLVELIRRKGGRTSVRDLQRCRSYSTSEEAKAELNKLAGSGHGSWSTAAPGPKGGRPSECFILHDTTDIDETPASSGTSAVLSSSDLPDDGSAEIEGEFGVV